MAASPVTPATVGARSRNGMPGQLDEPDRAAVACAETLRVIAQARRLCHQLFRGSSLDYGGQKASCVATAPCWRTSAPPGR